MKLLWSLRKEMNTDLESFVLSNSTWIPLCSGYGSLWAHWKMVPWLGHSSFLQCKKLGRQEGLQVMAQARKKLE